MCHAAAESPAHLIVQGQAAGKAWELRLTYSALVSACKKGMQPVHTESRKSESFLKKRPGVLVACRVRCTRAHGADGCSGDHTAGDADTVCEPVAWSQVLAWPGPGMAHTAWCAGRTSSQGLVAHGAIGLCLIAAPRLVARTWSADQSKGCGS